MMTTEEPTKRPTGRAAQVAPGSEGQSSEAAQTSIPDVVTKGPELAPEPMPAIPPPLVKEPAELLTVLEAMSYLRVSRKGLSSLIEAGLPALQVGSRWRFMKSDIDAWLAGSGTRS